jgi:hypothetical protein
MAPRNRQPAGGGQVGEMRKYDGAVYFNISTGVHQDPDAWSLGIDAVLDDELV